MAAFMTHPSVRIKGTENNYEPVLCAHSKCADRPAHMHCPFCVKTETYPDPVILKAHYRVKHVDKGLDFAGLKILRCCDHCDIVGTIKGEKKFKGPHWHCYKCRNGFNRRDEAIKHYKTHFRNPQTTFQIQVAQEVNIMLNNMSSCEGNEAVENIGDHHSQDYNMHSSLNDTINVSGNHISDGYYTPDGFTNLKNGDSSVSVAANETVDVGDTQTIMIIQERDGQTEYHDGTMIHSNQYSYDELIQHKCNLERHVEQLESRLKCLESYRAENERLKNHNDLLSQQVIRLQEELQDHKGAAGLKNTEKIDRLVDELQSKHKELLYAQLVRLRVEQTNSHNEAAVSIMRSGDISGDVTKDSEYTERPASKRSKVS